MHWRARELGVPSSWEAGKRVNCTVCPISKTHQPRTVCLVCRCSSYARGDFGLVHVHDLSIFSVSACYVDLIRLTVVDSSLLQGHVFLAVLPRYAKCKSCSLPAAISTIKKKCTKRTCVLGRHPVEGVRAIPFSLNSE